MRLICTSNSVSGSRRCPAVALIQSTNRAFAARLAARNFSRNAGVRRPAGRPCRSWPRSVTQPSPTASVSSFARSGLASSSHRRGVTPLVLLLNRSGNSRGEVGHGLRAEQLGVDGRDAVGAVGADDGQVRHPHLAAPAPSSIRLTRASLRLVAGVLRPHVVQEPAVDLVDDLQVPREQGLEQLDRPLLQGLGQQRVVGVGERADGQVPRLVPAELRLVEQDAHQFGDGHRRVRVVQLDRRPCPAARPSRSRGGGTGRRCRPASSGRGSTPAGTAATGRGASSRPGRGRG